MSLPLLSLSPLLPAPSHYCHMDDESDVQGAQKIQFMAATYHRILFNCYM